MRHHLADLGGIDSVRLRHALCVEEHVERAVKILHHRSVCGWHPAALRVRQLRRRLCWRRLLWQLSRRRILEMKLAEERGDAIVA